VTAAAAGSLGYYLLSRRNPFAWPNIRIASVATVVAVGGNGATGYTYDVRIPAEDATSVPHMLAGIPFRALASRIR
jgi:hypothetical protein